MLKRYVVKGHSMEPNFKDGDKILLSLLFLKLKKGDVVVFGGDSRDYLKRIVAVRNGSYIVAGDNRSHSRSYRISKSRIRGKFLMKY